jgi:hypothetical protein
VFAQASLIRVLSPCIVHNCVVISQFSQEVVTVVAESVIDMDGDEGISEELFRQLFSVR